MFRTNWCQSCDSSLPGRTITGEGLHLHLSKHLLSARIRQLGIPTNCIVHSAKLWVVPVILAFAVLLSPGIAEGQGRDEPVEILDETQDNYRVVVRILPRVPAVGQINFNVVPTFAADGSPVRNATITLTANDAEDIPTYQVRALNTPTTQEEYVGNLVLRAEGPWSIHVEVETEELGTEVFVSRLWVAPAAVGATPEAGWLMVLVMVAFFAGGGFIWLSSRRALARRASSQPKA